MKIISKYKDYYDYLQGIWGVDDKLVLDRTKFTPFPGPGQDYFIQTFYICGWKIQGLWMKEKLLFGEELRPYCYPERTVPKQWQNSRWGRERMNEIALNFVVNPPNTRKLTITNSILKAPFKLLKDSPNDKEKCPILLGKYMGEYRHHPILKEYGLHKIYPAETLWLMLTEWLSRDLNKAFVDTRTDAEKLQSYGFDPKTSFRNM